MPDKPAGLLTYIEVDYPFQKVGIDILGPFPETIGGMKYIIVAIDYLTKWAKTASMKTATTTDIDHFYVIQIAIRHGMSIALISDRG